MTYTTAVVQEFLADVFPFNQLSEAALNELGNKTQLLRYRMGQTVLLRDSMPSHISILYQGQVRLLGMNASQKTPITLKLLEPGEVLGWVSHLRGVACEMAIASTEAICLTLPVAEFMGFISREPRFAEAFRNQAGLVEVFELLKVELDRRADASKNVSELAQSVWKEAVVVNLAPGKAGATPLDPQRLWLFSGGSLADLPIGSRVDAATLLNLQVGKGGEPAWSACQSRLYFQRRCPKRLPLRSCCLPGRKTSPTRQSPLAAPTPQPDRGAIHWFKVEGHWMPRWPASKCSVSTLICRSVETCCGGS